MKLCLFEFFAYGSFTALKYFHYELGLVKSSLEKVFTHSRKQLKENADKVSASRNKNIERKKKNTNLKYNAKLITPTKINFSRGFFSQKAM